jgi:cell division protein FtsZ
MAQSAADPDANIIFGSVVDESLGDEVRITVIATGFQPRDADQRRPGGRAVQVQVPQATAVKSAPPPLPHEPRAKEPIRLAHPVAAPVAVHTVTAARPVRPAYKPADSEDQYDIPAFLRRNNTPRE